METLTDPIALRVFNLCFAMVNIVERQEESIVMGISFAAELRAPINHYPRQRNPLIVKEEEIHLDTKYRLLVGSISICSR
jgi:hypothetical protein